MGTPLPSALAMVTTSGTTPRRWWANQAPHRPRPVCTSSTMKSTPRSSHSRRTPWKYAAVAGFTPPSPCTGSSRTAATDGASAASSSSRSSHVTWRKPSGQGLEGFVLGRLPGGVQGGEGAAVERAVGADHLVAAPAAEAAGQLQRALVGLGTGVGEEHLAAQASVLGPAGLARRRGGGRGSGPPASPARCRTGWTRGGASAPARAGPRRPRGGCAPGWSPRGPRGGRGTCGRRGPTPRPRRRGRAAGSAARRSA